MAEGADLLIFAGKVVTSNGASENPLSGEKLSQIEVISEGAVAVKDGKIVAVGPEKEVGEKFPQEQARRVIEAPGKTLTPGLIDPHTHTVFGGSREEEFALRISGVPYLEILKKGGGILDTVRATRETPYEALLEKSRKHLDRMLGQGTTTAEVKSGYGLDLDTEMKMLQVIKQLDREHFMDLEATFLGAHALPPEYRERPDDFIDFMAEEVLPRVAEEKLAKNCDIFCEEGIFDIEQSRRLLRKALELGFEIRFHADEMVSLGGAELAAELGARSADHLLKISKEGMQAMSEKGVVATLLPATPFTLMKNEYAPAREIIDSGVTVALASDFNPGSCPTHSLPLVMTLACLQMKLTPEEALNGVTINAAHSLGRAQEIGSIEVGKQGDLVIWDAPNHRFLPYHYGSNLAETVIKRGRVVVESGRIKEGK